MVNQLLTLIISTSNVIPAMPHAVTVKMESLVKMSRKFCNLKKIADDKYN